jgi:hypothetical protein
VAENGKQESDQGCQRQDCPQAVGPVGIAVVRETSVRED